MFRQLTNSVKALLFYVIAFSLAVSVAAMSPLFGEGTPLITMFTPLAAVVIMLFVVTGDGYSKAGLRVLGLHRSGIRSWGLALLVPLVVLGVAYGIIWSVGMASVAVPTGAEPLISLPFKLVVAIVLGTPFGALGEEIGWRGYLLPHLLSLGPLHAMLLTGFLHGIWHIPLLLLTPLYHSAGNKFIVIPLFLVTLTLGGVFYGYLRLTTNSVWPAAIAHRAYNVFWDRFAKFTVAASPLTTEYVLGESGLLPLAGITIVTVWVAYRLKKRSVNVGGFGF